MSQTTATPAPTVPHVLRLVAGLIDMVAPADVDLAVPGSVTAHPADYRPGDHYDATLIFHGFDAFYWVERWAEWLGVPFETRLVDGEREFIDAHAKLADIRIRITSNRNIDEHQAEMDRRAGITA